VLRAALPHKEEYVILVRMSLIQRKLYNAFMTVIREGGLASWANGNNPIKAFSVFCKVRQLIEMKILNLNFTTYKPNVILQVIQQTPLVWLAVLRQHLQVGVVNHKLTT